MNKLLILYLGIFSLIAQERKDILEVFPQPIWQEILDYLPASEAFATYCLYVKKADSSPKIPLTSLQAEKFANVWDQKIQNKLSKLWHLRDSEHMSATELKPRVISYLKKLNRAGRLLNDTSNALVSNKLWPALFADKLISPPFSHISIIERAGSKNTYPVYIFPSKKINEMLKLLFLSKDGQATIFQTLVNYQDYQHELEKYYFRMINWDDIRRMGFGPCY